MPECDDMTPHVKTDIRIVPAEAGLAIRNTSPVKKPGRLAITIDSQRSKASGRK
jgi:hypothetical protein